MQTLSGRHYHFRQATGLTLLEVLLTLAILIAVAAFAVPVLDGVLTQRRLERAAEQVRLLMLQTRLEAMRTGRVQVMHCPPETNQVSVTPLTSLSDLTEAADQIGAGGSLLMGAQTTVPQMLPMQTEVVSKTSELAEGVKFASTRVETSIRSMITSSQTGLQGVEQQQSSPIFFYPDGTSSSAIVTVEQEGGGQLLIVLRGLTGEARVQDALL